jgi:hypothetical protein
VQLAGQSGAVERFHEILRGVRQRAPRLFEAPILDGRHLGVEALTNLARHHKWHLRPVRDWMGEGASWQPVLNSLAHHLVCKFRVPAFLASAWYATDAGADKKRGWFVEHAGGVSFRSLDLPMEMTRKMEHIFLASHDHLPIELAMRLAELRALHAPAALINAISSTRLATQLENGEFWRTFWMFLVQNASELDLRQVAPMIDYIQAIRHERITIETADGRIVVEPPQPDFSLKGRKVPSLMRLMREWHKSLGTNGPNLSWKSTPFQPMLVQERVEDALKPARHWHMTELTSSAQLRREGAALHHCVASYAYQCSRGSTSIWSLQLWQEGKVRPVLTVEVDPGRKTVVQVRGCANRTASGRPLRLLQNWAEREGLKMAV